jgi:hypothetical protein
MHTKVRMENLKRPLGRPRCSQDDNIKMDLKEVFRGVWIGFIWIKIGSSGKLSSTWKLTVRFH